ncbi:unnamed protein product, partial [Rotaria magnacalcarata]
MQYSAIMICYRECLLNLEKFNGGEEYKILQFINDIERIGKTVDANDNILYCMCTVKLDGEAKRWYEDNVSLIQWKQLKLALLERSTTSDSSSKIFEQLKEHEQEFLDENVPDPQETAPYAPYFANTVSRTNYASSTLRTPIYINIYHTEFVYKKKLHKSANCTSINIIGEIQLEDKIQGHKTLIIADVATNLITDLLLGNDWIMQNNVIIDSLQRHITLLDKNRRELAVAPFSQPSNLQFSATNRQRTLSKNTQLGHMSYQAELNNHIILPVLSEDANYQQTHFKSFIYKRNNTRKSGFCDSLL